MIDGLTLSPIDGTAKYEDLESAASLQVDHFREDGILRIYDEEEAVIERMEVMMKRRGDHLCFLLKDQYQLPIGYYYCEVQNNTKLWLFDLFVSQNIRNCGCATFMFQHAIETTKIRGYEEIRFSMPRKFKEYVRYPYIVDKLAGLGFNQIGNGSGYFSWKNLHRPIIYN